MSDEIVVDAISAAIGGYPRLTTSQSPRHGALAALALLIIGAILLLPGLCAVFFARDMLTNPNVVLGGLIVWAAGLILGALGVWLYHSYSARPMMTAYSEW